MCTSRMSAVPHAAACVLPWCHCCVEDVHAHASRCTRLQHSRIWLAGYANCTASTLAQCPEVREYLSDYFGYDYSFRWWCVLILMAFIICFRVFAMLALRSVKGR